MASKLQDTLYEIFSAVAGEQTRFPARGTETFTDGEAGAAGEIGASVGRSVLEQVQEAVARPAVSSGAAEAQVNTSSVLHSAVDSVLSLTPASGLVTDVLKQAESGGSVESIATTVLKSALGMMPLVSGLLGLFGGGEKEAPPALVKYAMPSALEFQAAEIGGQEIASVDYDQTGRPRVVGGADAGASGGAATVGGGASGGATAGGASGAQITVNVNAMDARSFLDRSSDIAAAVREAMLNLNSINDVVNEL